jgi:hypothetical protein
MSITLPARTAAPASATPSPVRSNAAPMRSGPTTRTRIPNNRHPYLAWGTAWLVGYGAFALAGGNNPVVAMPGLVPTVLLTGGLIAAAAVTTIATIRDQRGVTGPAKTTGTLFRRRRNRGMPPYHSDPTRTRRPAHLSPTTRHAAGNGDRAAPGSTVPRISVTTSLVASPR